MTLTKIHGHDLPGFRNVAHHGHKAFVFVVGPPCIGFMGHNFGGIDVQRHFFTAVLFYSSAGLTATGLYSPCTQASSVVACPLASANRQAWSPGEVS